MSFFGSVFGVLWYFGFGGPYVFLATEAVAMQSDEEKVSELHEMHGFGVSASLESI